MRAVPLAIGLLLALSGCGDASSSTRSSPAPPDTAVPVHDVCRTTTTYTGYTHYLAQKSSMIAEVVVVALQPAEKQGSFDYLAAVRVTGPHAGDYLLATDTASGLGTVLPLGPAAAAFDFPGQSDSEAALADYSARLLAGHEAKSVSDCLR